MSLFALALLLAKTTLVLVAALTVTRLLQRASATARHVVWVVALAALLAIPAVAAWAPLRIAALPPAVADPSTPRVAPMVDAANRFAAAEPQRASSMSGGDPAVRLASRPTAEVPSPSTPRAAWSPSLTTLALLAWALVALLIGAAYAHGWVAVRRIVRRATPLTGRDWVDTLYEASDRLELAEPPRLLRSSDSTMPFACGIAHPTIVLPAESDAWTAERRRAVLLHELAHVRRRDLVGHTFARFVCAVYWFHPLVWTAARHMRAESERACDDLALVCGERAADYAEHLLDIVTSVRRDRTPLVALAMARRSEFEGRMLAILDPERPRVVTRGRRITASAAGLATLALLVGAVAPTRRQAPTRHPERAATTADTLPIALDTATRSSATPTPRPLAVATPAVSHIASHTETHTEMRVETRLDTRIDTRLDRATAPSLAGSALRLGGADTSGDRAALLARVLRSDTSASIRRVAAWGLAEYGHSAAGADALVAAVRGDRDAGVREMAAWALAEMDGRGSDVSNALVGAMRDPDARVRATATWALGDIGDRGAAEALVRALADSSSRVRERAVWALGNVDLRDAPAPLVALLRDPDPHTRLMTAWALYNIEDPSTLSALQAAVRSEKDQRVQVGELRALAALGDPAVDAIRELVDSPDPKVRAMAVRALAGGEATGPWPWPWPEPRPNP